MINAYILVIKAQSKKSLRGVKWDNSVTEHHRIWGFLLNGR
jgi:hypothetical protein